MPALRPFRALRPRPDRAAHVAAPPYDVVDVAEARALAAGNPGCFLHVSRPEIDLPDGSPAGDVHERGRAALLTLVEQGVLVRDDRPTLSVYRQYRAASGSRGRVEQTGVVGLAEVADYRAGRIAVHEHTRPDKEDDRTAHLATLEAHDEPVLLMYPRRADVDTLVAGVTRRPPAMEVTDPDHVTHTIWIVDGADDLCAFARAFGQIPKLYVADGHHRSAAAARLDDQARRLGTPEGETDAFPVVAFPAEELTVLPYQRVVAGPLPVDGPGLIADLDQRFDVTAAQGVPAIGRHRFGMYLQGRWWLLTPRPGTVDESDPVARLDVAVLQDAVLAPALGVTDPRTDPRITFVAGSRSTEYLERLVDGGTFAVAFALHPTSPDEVMSVADAGLVMPPKSTWFDPKLASGLFVHPLE